MFETAPLVSVNLCTYFRPDGLERCLFSLFRQEFAHPFEIVVVDNDENGSAGPLVETLRSEAVARGIDLHYHIEPEQNISLARNRAIAASRGQYIAFIDDDEWAEPDWLNQLLQKLEATGADGVRGPVLPVFPDEFPQFWRDMPYFRFQRAEVDRTGKAAGIATGNLLVRREILGLRPGPFDYRLGRTGGSDSELFSFLARHHGCVFYRAPASALAELQPMERASQRWHVRRMYRFGYATTRSECQDRGWLRAAAAACCRAGRYVLGTPLDILREYRHPLRCAEYVLLRYARIAGLVGGLFGLRSIEYASEMPREPAPPHSQNTGASSRRSANKAA